MTIINMYINRLALLHVILILIGLCNQQFNILEFFIIIMFTKISIMFVNIVELNICTGS